MQSKVEVMRALCYIVARRVLVVVALIILIISILLLLGIWSLAYYFSAWWWLLLFIYTPLVAAAFFVYVIASFIVRKIYPRPIRDNQRRLLENFVGKIQRLLEVRGIGWWVFALQSLKDLLLYRDLKTLKELIVDTTSLKKDFSELEAMIQETT